MPYVHAFSFDDRELAAVLAGLRLLQHALLDENHPVPAAVWDIVTNGDLSYPLSGEEIDDLCQELNE